MRSGLSRAAINYGYGYNDAALFGGMSYNDAALYGGMSYNDAALEGGMSYNDAALEGGMSYNDAAIEGGMSYNEAALEGGRKPKFAKGSPEAKAFMARLRAMRGKKKKTGGACPGGSMIGCSRKRKRGYYGGAEDDDDDIPPPPPPPPEDDDIPPPPPPPPRKKAAPTVDGDEEGIKQRREYARKLKEDAEKNSKVPIGDMPQSKAQFQKLLTELQKAAPGLAKQFMANPTKETGQQIIEQAGGLLSGQLTNILRNPATFAALASEYGTFAKKLIQTATGAEREFQRPKLTKTENGLATCLWYLKNAEPDNYAYVLRYLEEHF